MVKEKFTMILQKDEEIKWSNGVNKFPFIIKKASFNLLGYAVAGVFIAQFFTIFSNIGSQGRVGLQIWPKTFIIVFIIGIIISIISAILNSNNTYFCITNKRIIKREGAFNNKFIHYSLKNVGTVGVTGSLVDNKSKNASANLLITVKDFHMNTDGNSKPIRLIIQSLICAYEAYKLLSELVEGNNEVLRIKTEE